MSESIEHKLKDIREALSNNCFYVYMQGPGVAHRRIINVRTRNNNLEVKLLFNEVWITVIPKDQIFLQ